MSILSKVKTNAAKFAITGMVAVATMGPVASALPTQVYAAESTTTTAENSVSDESEQNDTNDEVSSQEESAEQLKAKLNEAIKNNAPDSDKLELWNKLIKATKTESEKRAEDSKAASSDSAATDSEEKTTSSTTDEVDANAIKNIDPSDINTFPNGHYWVNDVEVYSDQYCTALIYHEDHYFYKTYCAGSIYIKDTNIWSKGAITKIGDVPLNKIIVPEGCERGTYTYGEVSSISLYNDPNAAYKYHVNVTGGGASFSLADYYTTFDMTFMDKSGDKYDLSLSSWFAGTDTSRVHTVSYNSDNPDIVRIDWEGITTGN